MRQSLPIPPYPAEAIMSLHTLMTIFGIQPLFTALIVLFASAVKGCFPLMSPGGCGGGGSCCMLGGCGDGGGFSGPSPGYVDPAYPVNPGPYTPYSAKSRSMAMAPSSASHTAAFASMDPSCAKRYMDTRLSCALPFERRTPSDESECQRHCSNAMPRCRSFQYDPAGSVCDLFEHSLGPSSSSKSRDSLEDGWNAKVGKRRNNVLLANKIRHRRRKRFFVHSGVPLDWQSRTMASGVSTLAQTALSPALSQPSGSSSCVPTLETLSGSVFVGFDSVCTASAARTPSPLDPFLLTEDQNEEKGQPTDDSQLPAPLPPPPPPPPPSPTRKASSGESLEPFLSSTVPSSSQNYDGKGGHYGSSRRERVENGVAEMHPVGSGFAADQSSDCPTDGARARVQLIDGIALTGQSPIARVQLDSADVCMHVCRQNALLDGRRLPMPCRAATFHRQNGRCELLSDSISPNGALQYVPNPDSLYFEKICISRNELATGCDDVIHRIPQHHLDPRRATDGGSVLTASSQLDCLRKCISAKSQFGFDCVSASFFFDWPTQNCYLSRFTRLSRPDLYAAERRELVDYLEMPPCFQLPARVRQHDVPTEASSLTWSPCVGGIRWRPKNCTKNSAEEVENDEQCVEREFCGKSMAGTGKGCGETGKCGDESDGQKAALSTAPEVVKQVAPNFEVAKRFKGPSVASEEASLFGEQDYDNQKEVSFFGPPHRPLHTGANTVTAKIAERCDPKQKCCPIETAKGMVRGCSLGTRTLADGRTTVSCVPDECQ
uniref:Apple domain-containing protein n=1 Tax=Globodera rostochiensis TaxID=31243 RepID=A0A914GYK9_GLORO